MHVCSNMMAASEQFRHIYADQHLFSSLKTIQEIQIKQVCNFFGIII